MSSSVEPQQTPSLTTTTRQESTREEATSTTPADSTAQVTLSAPESSYANYRAPKANQNALIAPSFDSLANIIQKSSFDSDSAEVRFCELSLADARREARQEAIDLAKAHCSKYTNRFTDLKFDEQPIILAGHQPDLFHAGVWFKNFLISSLAKSTNAISINFAVDNDLCRNTHIRVPAKQANGSITQAVVKYDSPRAAVPWELRSLESQATWDSFPTEVSKHLDIAESLLVHELWPLASEALREHPNIGRAFSQARHKIELAEQVENLEVSLSSLVSTRTFARFSIQLLSALPRFQQAYNRQCDAYRKAHKIRNRAHPVPNLEQSDGWLEAPLWVYRASAPARQRLWVRQDESGLILSDRSGWQDVIEGKVNCECASQQWLDLLAEGVMLRPRALLTTMYLRMMVADLFVHGIGGGKYDQVTDCIIEEFFGLKPPPLAVATATMKLPHLNEEHSVTLDELEQQQQELKSERWRLQHNPQESDNNSAQYAELLNRKKNLIDAMPPKGERWRWHHDLKAVNKQLKELQQGRFAELDKQSNLLQQKIREAKMRDSREYAYCLFGQSYIAGALRGMANIEDA